VEILTFQCFVSFLSFSATYYIVNHVLQLDLGKIRFEGRNVEEKLVFLYKYLCCSLLTLHLGKSDSTEKQTQ